jgi:MarR family transcriptional regulator, transcriptional regulator for hemolysin
MSAVIDTASEIRVQSEDCPECLMGNLNWLLAQANHALASELAAAFAPLGITPRGHAVLGAAGSGAHTQKQLAEMVGLDKTTMVATIDELEAAGFARRVPSPTDRRAHVIEVTPIGRKKFTAAMKTIKRVQDDVLASLGEDDGAALMECLGRLVKDRLAEPAACNGVRRREPRVSAL